MAHLQQNQGPAANAQAPAPVKPDAATQGPDYQLLGRLDTAANWRLICRPNPLYTTLGLANCRVSPFINEMTGTLGHQIAVLYSAARVGNFNGDRRDIWPLAALEVTAPLVPHQSQRGTVEARAALLRAAQGLARGPTWEYVSEFLEPNTTVANAILPHFNKNLGYSRPIIQDVANRATIETIRNATFAPLDPNPDNRALLTVESAMLMFGLLAAHGDETLINAPLKLCMMSIVSLGKQGTLTPAFLTKLRRNLSGELRTDIALVPDELRSVYNTIKSTFTRDNVAAVMRHWGEVVPQNALRIRLTVEHMAGCGLTVYFIICRALRAFEDFPWPRIFGLLQTEVAAFEAALNAVGNNACAGFEAGRQAWASNKMRGLAYISSELLKAAGEASLANYAGIQGVPFEVRLRAMVRAHSEGRMAEYEAEHPADVNPAWVARYHDLKARVPEQLVIPPAPEQPIQNVALAGENMPAVIEIDFA